MSNHPLRYFVRVGAYELLVHEIDGVEELSRAWKLVAKLPLDPQTMKGPPSEFDPDEVIKETATIVLERQGEVAREITGVVMECELSASLTGVPQVEMTLGPRLTLLQHRRDIRIHRNLDVPQIVTEVCTALGVSIDNRLTQSYDVRPYCVQWRETDYDYVNRLLEDEGIFYYFTAGDVMVLGDDPKSYEPVPGDKTIPFRHEAGANLNEDAVHAFGSRAELTPGRVTLRDWNTEHPSLDMDVVEDTSLPEMPEWYDYPGEYEDPGEGKRKARLHAEAFDRKAAAAKGKSTCGRLYPGCVFELADAPVGTTGGEHVVRRLEHAFDLTEAGFQNVFEADIAEVTYRPPRDTFVPRIFNPLTGFVCTNGEDIQCDHFGRVKVHFHWDRLRPYDDDCSHWIPVLQDNSGGSSGIPRKGWEVVCHFLEGDPDRPIVVGRVYNGDDVFQEKLPHAKDRSSLTSQTSPTRDSASEIRFEDAKGLERIFMRAPKDQNIRVAGDQNIGVGNDNTEVVENDETVEIGGDATWEIQDRLEPSVGNSQTWEVTGNRTKKVGASDTNSVGGDHELKITGNHQQKIFADVNTSCETLEETFESSLTEKCDNKHTTEIGEALTYEIGGSLDQTAKLGKVEATGNDRTEKIGGIHRIESQDEVQMRYELTRTSTIDGSVEAKCKKTFSMVASKHLQVNSATATWKAGKTLSLVVTDAAGENSSHIIFKDGQIHISAVDKVTIDIAGPANQGSGTSTQISPAAE